MARARLVKLAAVLALVACRPSGATAKASSVADDTSRSADDRCADAFATFRTRIHAGDTATAVHAVLGSPTWIGSDEPVDVLGGEVPVEMVDTDQTVAVMCLPQPDARAGGRLWSRWVIYARLEGRDSKTFGAFLSSGGTKKLVEYALCHVESDGVKMKIDKFR